MILRQHNQGSVTYRLHEGGLELLDSGQNSFFSIEGDGSSRDMSIRPFNSESSRVGRRDSGFGPDFTVSVGSTGRIPVCPPSDVRFSTESF